MTLRWMDGFDHYDDITELGRKWSYYAGLSTYGVYTQSSGSGRHGGTSRSILMGRYATSGATETWALKYVPSGDVWILGAAFKVGRLAYMSAGLDLWDDTEAQVGAYINSSGNIFVRTRGSSGAGGTILATSSNAIAINTWYYIEFKVTIANSGTYQVRVNGEDWIPSASGDTQYTANASANKVGVRWAYGDGQSSGLYGTWIDDFYACDDAGSVNNDFLGDCRIEALLPDGAGAYSQWSASAGSNYQCVDDADPDDDSTYVSESTVSDRDSYTFGDLVTTSGNVKGLQIIPYARKNNAGPKSIKSFARIGGSDYDASSASYLGDNYLYFPNLSETSPATATAWTIAEINGAEFGVKVES